MYIYMAGALTTHHRNNEIHRATIWRNSLSAWSHELKDMKTFNPAIAFLREKNHSYAPEMCVSQNEFYLAKCDIMIVDLNEIDSSPGTIYELVRFKDMRKPVVAFGVRHWSPHINVMYFASM